MADISDILAYYLSEYDMAAFNELGYKNRSQGFEGLGKIIGKKKNYMKRLRDEYDVVTSSYRSGQKNRDPRPRIIETKNYLSVLSYDELTELVHSLLNNTQNITAADTSDISEYENGSFDEEVIEKLMNQKDSSAAIKLVDGKKAIRVYNTSVIKQLKKIYNGTCQLCGKKPFDMHNVDISEVHHISYFSKSLNNNLDNLIVLCPNHHRLIHKLNPTYDNDKKEFVFDSGETLKISFNYHL